MYNPDTYCTEYRLIEQNVYYRIVACTTVPQLLPVEYYSSPYPGKQSWRGTRMHLPFIVFLQSDIIFSNDHMYPHSNGAICNLEPCIRFSVVPVPAGGFCRLSQSLHSTEVAVWFVTPDAATAT